MSQNNSQLSLKKLIISSIWEPIMSNAKSDITTNYWQEEDEEYSSDLDGKMPQTLVEYYEKLKQAKSLLSEIEDAADEEIKMRDLEREKLSREELMAKDEASAKLKKYQENMKIMNECCTRTPATLRVVPDNKNQKWNGAAL